MKGWFLFLRNLRVREKRVSPSNSGFWPWLICHIVLVFQIGGMISAGHVPTPLLVLDLVFSLSSIQFLFWMTSTVNPPEATAEKIAESGISSI